MYSDFSAPEDDEQEVTDTRVQLIAAQRLLIQHNREQLALGAILIRQCEESLKLVKTLFAPTTQDQ